MLMKRNVNEKKVCNIKEKNNENKLKFKKHQ